MRARESIRVVSFSGKERWSGLVNLTPSWMRAASGTARKELAADTRSETTCREWPRMYSGLVLLSETWCRRLTAGILRPDFGTFKPSASSTSTPPRRWAEKRLRAICVQRRVSVSRSIP